MLLSLLLRSPELHMQAGDVLLFVDCLTHGAARRTNPGVRRTIWHRYSMAWSRLRWGYTVSTELCDRLAAGCAHAPQNTPTPAVLRTTPAPDLAADN